MLKWLLTIVIAMIVFSAALPVLQRWLGIGQLPGDFRFRLFRREYFLPIGSTIVLSLIAAAIARWL